MKRRILVKMLIKAGFRLDRHGGSHDVYVRGADEEVIPRHREIDEELAKHLIKKWGLK